MLKEVYKETEARMRGAIQALEEDLSGIRTGRASPALVERLQVEYYGTPTPLIQLASTSVPEPRMLLIRPFDPATMKIIERAILASDLGLNPSNDGKAIRLILPPLTEERRRDMIKVVRHEAEGARVAIRNIRRDANNDFKELLKEKEISEDDERRAQEQIQKLTDQAVADVEKVLQAKEAELMEV